MPFVLLLKVVTEFTAGCLIYLVYTRLRGKVLRVDWFGYAVAALFAISVIVLCKMANVSHDWLAVLFPFVILVVARSSGPLSKILGSRPAVYWGKVSYSLYMTHNITLWFLKALLPVQGRGATVPVFIAYIVAISVVAVLTYHFVEEPSRKWMRARKTKRSAVALAEA